MDSIIYQRIKALCSERGITVTKLETLMGYSQSTIGKWRSAMPTADKLIKVAQYFDVSMDYIVGLSAYKKHETQNLIAGDMGLSENAVKALVECKKHSPSLIQTVNLLLENEYYRPCLDCPEAGPSVLRYLSMYLLFNESGVDGDFAFMPNGEVTQSDANNPVLSVPMGTFCTEALFNLTMNEIKLLRNEVLADEVFGRIE